MANIVTGERYNKLSFVVRGDTEIIKENLKQLGGRWNPNLKNGAGWLFNIKKHTASVNDFFQKIKKYHVTVDGQDEVHSDETCSEDEEFWEQEFWEDDKICDYDTVFMALSTLFVFLVMFSY